MRLLKSTFCILLLSSIPISGLFAQETSAPAAATAQEQQDESFQQMSVDSLMKVARIIADSAACKALITVDEAGKPHARVMAPFALEEDWVIWMGTTQGSRKTKQIMGNPNVVVFYYEPTGRSYVSVSGKARLVNDPDKKSKYWVDAWSAFYKDVDKDYVLIEVTPENLEICSFKYNIWWDSKGDSKLVDFVKK